MADRAALITDFLPSWWSKAPRDVAWDEVFVPVVAPAGTVWTHADIRVRDAALVPLIDSFRIDRFLVGGGWAWLTVRHDQISRITLDGLELRDEQLTPYHDDEYMLRVARDLLDQQIIDAQDRKVVRVTDLTFEVIAANGHDELRVTEVDIGLRSIFRRITQGVLPVGWIRRLQNVIPPHSIPWEVCNIVEPDPQRRLRLNISTDLLEKMHPADLAEWMSVTEPSVYRWRDEAVEAVARVLREELEYPETHFGFQNVLLL